MRFIFAATGLALLASLALASVVSCASEKVTPPPKVTAPPPPPPPPDHPRTWAEVPEFYGGKCPTPAFVLDTPQKRSTAGAEWTVMGSTARREGTWQGPLIIGVLGAIKDATPDTEENLRKAKAAFDKAKVNVILCNGDVAETAEIHDVANLIGKVFGDARPILVHSGNSEWTGGFTDAFVDAEKEHPSIFNMNFIRDMDFGGVHLVSLPGWSVKKFVKQGGCFYKAEDVDSVRAIVEGINAKGEVAIISAHGPPRGVDRKSLDATHDYGNVGDETLAKLLQDGIVHFGIFGHILEAGGRATEDATKHKPLKLPMKKPTKSLFVNVGSASSFGIEMIDGKKRTSRGMAAVVTVDVAANNAKVSFIQLRK